jgi:hypothetical protein
VREENGWKFAMGGKGSEIVKQQKGLNFVPGRILFPFSISLFR